MADRYVTWPFAVTLRKTAKFRGRRGEGRQGGLARPIAIVRRLYGNPHGGSATCSRKKQFKYGMHPISVLTYYTNSADVKGES